ncbi:MAG: glycoside hydrolase family 95 protein [Clostridia bacterium]|nr:glycoside hydrolase family 95 protein [Clostridia bacterium]
MNKIIWFNKYRENWMDALPLGNGKTAAMFYGGTCTERIEINEESLWGGRQIEEKHNASKEILDKMRGLLFAGKNDEAIQLARQNYLAYPRSVYGYESMGEIIIDFDDKNDCWGYRKELDLEQGAVNLSYTKFRIKYSSQCFISEKHNVVAYRIRAENGAFSCNVSLEREQDAHTSAYNDEVLVMNGQLISMDDERKGPHCEGMHFAGMAKVITDGERTANKKFIRIENATELTIFAGFGTGYNVDKYDIDDSIDYKAQIEAEIEGAITEGYDSLLKQHIAQHKAEFERVSLDINGECRDHIPTDVRAELVRAGERDDSLCVLYFNFGRYLLLTSSGKCATLPANLQGKWCHGFAPPWGSDYHTNINIQMNYWPALPLNMEETMKPYVHFMKMISKFGEKTAQSLYGAKGWVIHHTTDIFGRTGVHDLGDVGFFPMAAPWLCLNLWEQYEFLMDKNFLDEIYPILKGSCEFLLDFLVEDEKGQLVTSPSNSPENSFYYEVDGEKKQSFFTYGATIDIEIIREIFTRTIYASRLLGRDEAFADKMQAAMTKLPPLKVSKRYGTICEWIEDYEEAEPGHRHISHLFSLFPGDMINEKDPEIFEAAKKTLTRRLSNGGGATGWSRAWIINFYARLNDGNAALEHFKWLLRLSTADNLFDMHPPFQIDGNFGSISGVAEMLLQSHLGTPGNRTVELLPALPDEWKSGHIKGIRARGCFEVDIEWAEGKATLSKIKAHADGTFKLKQNERTQIPGAANEVVEYKMKKGEELIITFK